MQDLQEVTHDLHYENYRATRLADGSDGEIAGAGNYFLNIWSVCCLYREFTVNI